MNVYSVWLVGGDIPEEPPMLLGLFSTKERALEFYNMLEDQYKIIVFKDSLDSLEGLHWEPIPEHQEKWERL